MATLNASKWGHILSSNSTTHAGVRDASTGFSATTNPTSTIDSIAYRRFSARRGNAYQIRRAFYYFDTSGITGTVSSATLNIAGGTGSSDVIVVASTAFSGDGSTNLVAQEYGNVAFSTLESNAHTWGTSNSITLLSGARIKIQNNNAFIVAVLQYDNDQQDVDSISNIEEVNQTNYGTTGYLDYTEAASGPANVASFLGITKANISTINTISLGNISELNGIS